MSGELDHTHDPSATSWVESANAPGTDFPVQNLPFAVFRRAGTDEKFRGGIGIGDQIVDLLALDAQHCVDGLAGGAVNAAAWPALNDFVAMGPDAWRALRHAMFAMLSLDADAGSVNAVRKSLVPQADAEYALPMTIGNFTDFYTSLDHARNVGRLFRPDSPVTPNFHWMPIAYHGRASSIVPSGRNIVRPTGQTFAAGANAPVYGPCARLDYEMELGVYVGPGNRHGQQIPLADAEQHVFGISLLNDWSARDIQSWESVPLGPFQAKNFATSVSPWIVTAEALVPFRGAWTIAADRPQPLPYLDSERNRQQGALDIRLEVWLDTAEGMRSKTGPLRLSSTSFRHQYWTIAQMITQHTVGGCNLQPGDLIGTGTISGSTPGEAGALIELTENGRKPLALNDGQSRKFLEDGDRVTFKGWCERPGFVRIGFGDCRGTIVPAIGSTQSTPMKSTEETL